MEAALDPIGYSEALQKAGMPKAQADLIARTQQAGLDKLMEAKNLAAKSDLKELEMRLSVKIEQSRRETLKWMFGMFLAFAAFIVTALK